MPKSTTYAAKVPGADGRIPYTLADDAVWADLYARQEPQIRQHMARPYLDGFDKVALPQTRVPQCIEVSARLRKLTGWQVDPVPALIGFDRFFEMLANRSFPAASFIRSREDFDYIEEPDIFHEIFGHTPLLTDPRFADFSQAIGETGTRCEAKDYSWLIRLYWFTVEFGLLREDGEIKALGSGLASSPEELEWSRSGEPEMRPFDVIDILRTPYRIDIPQPVYFVLEDPDQLFACAQRDLIGDIHRAQALALHAPKYPPEVA